MNKRALPVAAIVLVGFSATATADPLPRIPCELERVLDGDTADFTCSPWPGLVTHARVRVLGIDTPERGWRASCEDEALLAERATALAGDLLHGTVLLHIEGRDSFGRVLAHVTLADGSDYASVMLDSGLALPYTERGRGWCKKR